MENKLVYQLFIGKVSEILGFEKTVELLKEAKESFEVPKYCMCCEKDLSKEPIFTYCEVCACVDGMKNETK